MGNGAVEMSKKRSSWGDAHFECRMLAGAGAEVVKVEGVS